VLVTDRNRVVAEIGPPQIGRYIPDDPVLARGVREGWLTPARIRDGSPPPRPEPVMTLEELMKELAQDREDR
jgi:hypothetical protein